MEARTRSCSTTLSEADVAYIFMLNLRAMFAFPAEALTHEQLLLGLTRTSIR